MAFGKGLSNRRPPGVAGPVQSGQPGSSSILAGASAMQQVQMPGGPNQSQPMLGGVQMAQAGQQGKYGISQSLENHWSGKDEMENRRAYVMCHRNWYSRKATYTS